MADWDAHLLFTQLADNSGHLVFGDEGDDDGPTGNDAIANLQGSFPAFNGTLQAQYVVDATAGLQGEFPPFAGTLGAEYVAHAIANLQGSFPEFTGQLTAIYDSGVTRSLGAATAARFEQAQPAAATLAGSFESGHAAGQTLQDCFEPAHALRASQRAAFESTQHMGHTTTERFEEAQPLRQEALYAFETGNGLACRITGRHQEAQPLRMSAQYAFQTAIWLAHLLGSRFESAELHAWLHADSAQLAIPLHDNITTGRFQEGMVPPPGVQGDGNGGGGEQEPCYKPDAKLVFCKQADGTANLLFECCECDDGEQPGNTIRVPIKRIYVVHNEITLKRMEGDVALHPLAFSLDLDVDSATFQWSATLQGIDGANLGREANGDAPVVEALINGIPFRLRIESKKRDERFIPNRWQVSGGGLNAILGGDHAPVQTFTNASTVMASQLANEVLTANGVPFGWSVDWQIPDWQIPAGTWVFNGTFLAAIKEIATSVGAYVQPHPTQQILHILPRYPLMPWDWRAQVTPVYELPSSMVDVRGTEFIDRPKYNAVYVGGDSTGSPFGQITRAGTPGTLLAEQAIHSLITAAEPQKLLGGRILADTGNQEHVTLSLQVTPETGVILPGKFAQHTFPQEDGRDMLGIVRTLGIRWSFPRLRQEITLETHPHV